MTDGDISTQLENWKEEHPEAQAEAPAPDKPCFTCQAKAAALRKSVDSNEQMLRLRDLLFVRIYEDLRKDDDISKVVLITDDSCPPCDTATEVFRPLIDTGAIEILPYSKCTPGDKDCIAAQGITKVPALASRLADGKIKKFYPLAGPASISIGGDHAEV